MTFLEAIQYRRGQLRLLDQLRLPHEEVYLDVATAEAGWQAIRLMNVRGAPAIALAAVLAVAVELHAEEARLGRGSAAEAAAWIVTKLEYLRTSRPTAVNLSTAVAQLSRVVTQAAEGGDAAAVVLAYYQAAESMLLQDLADNKAVGAHGAAAVAQACLRADASPKYRLLTHCNTGSLATAGWGTALGVARSLHEQQRLDRVFLDETRPYLQGARLSAYEMVHDHIPATLICDGSAAAALRSQRIDAVVVGADRVVANGDTANKIGTYHLAIAAAYHNVPFFVAAPSTSIDLSLASGESIVIEERDPREITHIRDVAIAPAGIEVWNPSFDVTPGALITAIITERGVAWRDRTTNAFPQLRNLATGASSTSSS